MQRFALVTTPQQGAPIDSVRRPTRLHHAHVDLAAVVVGQLPFTLVLSDRVGLASLSSACWRRSPSPCFEQRKATPGILQTAHCCGTAWLPTASSLADGLPCYSPP
jgi:hypothetical protein